MKMLTDEERHALQPKVEECRAATEAYRVAWEKADRLARELKARGLCGHCSIGHHGDCHDYGCVCCGAGK